MIRQFFISLLFAAIAYSSDLPVVTTEGLADQAGKDGFAAYQEYRFLITTPGATGPENRMCYKFCEDGTLKCSRNGKVWSIYDNSKIPSQDPKNPWRILQVLGATIIARSEMFIPSFAPKNERFESIVAIGPNHFISVALNNVPDKEDSLQLDVFETNFPTGKIKKLSSFVIEPELESYKRQYRLGEGLLLSDNIICLMGSSAPHLFVNSLIFYEVKQRKCIGFKFFGELQWLPNQAAFWLTKPIPKGMQTDVSVHEAFANGKVVPVFIGDKFNPEFSEGLNEIKQ